MRIKDDVAAGLGLCAKTQAVRRTSASITVVKTVTGRRVAADGGNSRGTRGSRARARARGIWVSARARGLAVDGQVGVAAVRAAFARVEGLTWVDPARASACVRVTSGEDDKVAGCMVVAVLPAGGPAFDGDGKVWTWGWVVAESRDERSCARLGRCRGRGRGGGPCGGQ
jgi:hypothetical protein